MAKLGWKRGPLARILYVASGAALLGYARRHPIERNTDLSQARHEVEVEYLSRLDLETGPTTTPVHMPPTAPPAPSRGKPDVPKKPKKKKKLKLPGIARMAITAFKAWSKDQVPRRGAALAYYSLFAVGPVLIVAIAIAGAVFGAEAARGEIVGQIDNLIGTQGAQAVQSVLAAAGRKTRGATIGGIVALIVAATGAFLELQAALNTIWRVKQKKTANIKLHMKIWNLVWKRLKSLGLVVSLGFLLLVSLAVSAGLSALGGWLARTTSIAPALLDTFNILFSLAFITTLFALIYRILPDVELQWRDVWVGALITAGLFTLGKEGIGLYLGRSSTASAYGAAGSLVVLLLWVYYSAQLVLLGAEFTRVYTLSRRHAPKPEPHASRGAKARTKEARGK